MFYIQVLILVIVLVIFVTAFYFSRVVIYPITREPQYTLSMEIKEGRIIREKFDEYTKEEVYIKSPYGYYLYGLYFPMEGSNKAVIICHGITWSLFGAVKYVDIFLKRGFNVLVYDHRNHGRSGGKFTTYGLREKYDLKACTDWMFQRCGDNLIVGTMGESMGAATVLQNAAIDDRISFCISDSAYSDLRKLFKHILKMNFHLPIFPLFYVTSFITGIWTGMFFRTVSPIKDIEKINIPVFFIHGNEDRLIPKEMSIEMYNAKKGLKKLYIAPGAGHIDSYCRNMEEYDRLVGEFLTEAGIK